MNKIIELFEATKDRMNDRDQRSALGIVDSYARGSNVVISETKFDENGLPLNRDSLAAAIIPLVADLTKEKSYKVRHEARDWLDAPYRNEKWMTWRSNQRPLTTGRE